jgi:cytochrome P450
LTKACGDYYTAEHDINDPEVAAILRYRANALRKHGWTGEEIGRPEIMLPVVGTTNTVPIMFWILYNIFRTPGLAARIREESEPLVQHDEDHDVATLDISRMEKECPLLVSCYRETLRLANQGSSMRRVMTDTTISDGRGNTYLMKKGVDVQIPLGIAHSLESAWGPNVATFDPERFLPGKTQPGDDKLSKAAYIPFGGGKHLCPGRYFAFAEILAVASTIALGFEVEPIDGKFPEVAAAGATFASTAVKPVNDGAGFGIVIRRREGWEDRKWRYLS